MSRYFSMVKKLPLSPVPHEIRHLGKTSLEIYHHAGKKFAFIQRLVHAPQPLVALALANGKRRMPLPQTRMTIFFNIERRSARPAGEEYKKFFARLVQPFA